MIDRLSPHHVFAYRKMRLEALQNAPEMFDHEYEVEYKKPVKKFKEQITKNEIYGVFDDDQSMLRGIAAFTIRPELKHAHKGLIWGMYVPLAFRGTGVGRQLVTHIIESAKGRVEIIQLAVVSTNEPARRLYESLGFVEYGTEHRAVKIGNVYYDDVWMAMTL